MNIPEWPQQWHLSTSESKTPALDAWNFHLRRLAPEVLRDAVADALRKLAEAVFAEYESRLTPARTPEFETARSAVHGSRLKLISDERIVVGQRIVVTPDGKIRPLRDSDFPIVGVALVTAEPGNPVTFFKASNRD